jgi:hypothetical protein
VGRELRAATLGEAAASVPELSHNAPQIRRTLLSLPGAARQSDLLGVGVTRQDGTLHCQPDK